MAEDVWSALVQGVLAFAHSRAGVLTGTTFKDSEALVGALAADPTAQGVAKARLEQLKTDIKNLSDVGKKIAEAIKPQVDQATKAVQDMGTELGKSPFTWEAAAQAATRLGELLVAFDTALGIVAKKIAEPEPTPAARQAMEDQVRGITEPWKKPFRNLAADASQGFDALCHTLLGIDHSGASLADHLSWDRKTFRITAKLAQTKSTQLGSLGLDGASVEVFFSYKAPAKLGISVKSNLKAGLRGDKFLEKIIPGEAPTADSDSVAITLDTSDGLTFGDGPNKKLTLPVRFSFPAIELRELAIGLPDGPDKDSGRLDVIFTIAGKLGSVLGVVAEGGGVTVVWKKAGGGFDVSPKPPDSSGLKVDAGVVKGGGYLRYREAAREYGGVVDLKFTEIGLTAIGLITTDPFSFVVVISVHFLPKIDLSFGFTLNGLGGLLAVERGLSTDELIKGLREGAVDQLLFPDDPVMAAPGILDRLGKIFPVESGGFVVGPIAELGWGSQAGFLKARIGIVLALPNPAVVLLGSVQIGVPSADAPEKLRIVDLRAEVMAEITPDFFLVRVSLANSKVASITISGDMGMLIRWSGGGAFALSAGGFFPKYTPPPELADLRRIALEMSPPVDFLKLRATAYFAITANSLQFGGGISLSADLGPVSGHASLSVDALFQWSPRFTFDFIVDASVEIDAFGATIAAVSFHGELSGMKPWHLEGNASVDILFWTAHFDVGPIEWGDRDTTPPPTVSPVDIVCAALSKDAAWTTRLPAGSEMIVRLVPDATTPLLVHPLGALEAKQLLVPLEVTIDRIGSAAIDAHRVNLADPKVGGQDAAMVSHATDMFPPGHFIQLSADQQVARPDFEEFPCGLRLAASKGAVHGAPTGVVYEWHTVFPRSQILIPLALLKWNLSAISGLAVHNAAVAAALRQSRNSYMPVRKSVDPNLMALNDAGRVSIRRLDDLTRPAGTPSVMTTTEAARMIPGLPEGQTNSLQLVAVGFAA
jgi:hypothetical protein